MHGYDIKKLNRTRTRGMIRIIGVTTDFNGLFRNILWKKVTPKLFARPHPEIRGGSVYRTYMLCFSCRNETKPTCVMAGVGIVVDKTSPCICD